LKVRKRWFFLTLNSERRTGCESGHKQVSYASAGTGLLRRTKG